MGQATEAHGRCAMMIHINGKFYLCRPVPAGEHAEKAFRLTPLDRRGRKGEPYDVTRDELGIVACTCGDYTFRRQDEPNGPCKHGAALIALGLLEPDAAAAEADPAEWPAWTDQARFAPNRRGA
jgi:hypothetical protein